MESKKLSKAVAEALKKHGVKRPIVSIEHPADFSLGDYSTNVAMVYGKKLGLSPLDLARSLVIELKKQDLPEIDKLEIAGFGFINFYLKPTFFVSTIKEAMADKNYGWGNAYKKKKIIIEYTDPNPLKEFHIGHLMSNTIGESLSRLYEKNGATVKRACYQGDVGLHIAKAVWALKQMPWGFLKQWLWGTTSSRSKFLGRAYALGSKSFDEKTDVKKEIIDLNKALYDQPDFLTSLFYNLGKKWSLEYFDSLYQRLGTDFDFKVFESEVANLGLEIVKQGKQKNIFVDSNGATIFPGENYGLHTRVFINSDGLPTYEAKELALAQFKANLFNYDRSVVITGNEVNEYFKVLLKAMELIDPPTARKTIHLSHGMLRLPSGKMSSRTGQVVTAEDLILKVSEAIKEKMKDRSFSRSEKNDIAEAVAIAAIKFSILRQSPGKDIIFDFDKSLSLDGDSGPYLQYSCIRAKTLLAKAKLLGLKPDLSRLELPSGQLEKMISRFPEIVSRAGQELAPQYIVNYLLDLASIFNSFYAQKKIADSDNENSGYRLALTQSFLLVMEKGLYLLGIKVPAKM